MPARIAKELAVIGGIGIRFGCHCSHILVKRILNTSPSLERFQWFIQTLIPGVRFPGVARVSLGIENTEEDVERLIQTLNKIARKHQSNENSNISSKHNKTLNFSTAETKMQMEKFVTDMSYKVYSPFK
jgi:hypothetical protein